MMIAICVLTFGLVSLSGVAGYIYRANGISNIQSVLVTCTQDQVDRLRTMRWTYSGTIPPQLQTGGTTNPAVTPDPNHSATLTDTPIGPVRVLWEVGDGPGTTGDLKIITLRAVQVNPSPDVPDGYLITTVINTN